MPVPAGDMDSVVTNGAVESPAAEMGAYPGGAPAPKTKGRGLHRWRRILREHQREGSAAAAGDGGAGGDEDSAQLHKRRLPLASDVPKGKHEVAVEEESSTASVKSRFIPQQLSPAKLDPDLGLLIASAGFSVGAGGADSDNSEDRSSKSSAASAPRHDFFPFTRERDRARSRAPRASLHGKNPRAACARADRARAHSAVDPAEAENSRSSVESDLRSTNAVNVRRSGVSITSNGIHKVLSNGDDHSDEGQPSEEVRSTTGGYYKENGSSVVGRLVRGSGDSDADVEDTMDEGSVGKGENGLGMHSGADPYTESILLLQRTQEALENAMAWHTTPAPHRPDPYLAGRLRPLLLPLHRPRLEYPYHQAIPMLYCREELINGNFGTAFMLPPPIYYTGPPWNFLPPWKPDDKDGYYVFAVGENLTARRIFPQLNLILQHATLEDLDVSTATSFFAVYDGHGGPAVAQYCATHFHLEVLNHPEFHSNLPNAVGSTFFRMDELLREQEAREELTECSGKDYYEQPDKASFLNCFCVKRPSYRGPIDEGCTMCVALIRGRQIIVGNAGDSRCVLSRNGQVIALSTDHKPNVPNEVQRIQNAGCSIRYSRGAYRIDDGIAVSRAIGDMKFKKNKGLSPQLQALTCSPEIRFENIHDDTEFLAIACDGI